MCPGSSSSGRSSLPAHGRGKAPHSSWEKSSHRHHQDRCLGAVPRHERSKVSVQSTSLQTAAWMEFWLLCPHLQLCKVEEDLPLNSLWFGNCRQSLWDASRVVLWTTSTLFPMEKEPQCALLMHLPHQTYLYSLLVLFFFQIMCLWFVFNLHQGLVHIVMTLILFCWNFEKL